MSRKICPEETVERSGKIQFCNSGIGFESRAFSVRVVVRDRKIITTFRRRTADQIKQYDFINMTLFITIRLTAHRAEDTTLRTG